MNERQMGAALKPCPCGAGRSIEGLSPSWEWELTPTGERTGRKEWTVWCGSCGRTGTMMHSEEGAINRWNTRAEPHL